MFLTLSTLCLVFKWHPSHNKDHHQSQLCLRRPSFSTKEDHIKLYPHPPPPKKRRRNKMPFKFYGRFPIQPKLCSTEGNTHTGAAVASAGNLSHGLSPRHLHKHSDGKNAECNLIHALTVQQQHLYLPTATPACACMYASRLDSSNRKEQRVPPTLRKWGSCHFPAAAKAGRTGSGHWSTFFFFFIKTKCTG